MKKNWLYQLRIRLLWFLRNRLRQKNAQPETERTTPWKLLRSLLIRSAQILHLIRLLISLIKRNWGNSAKS